MLAVRRSERALRRGRQYLRPISTDGSTFFLPRRSGAGRLTSLVGWSRILADHEILVVINTDVETQRAAWVTVDAGLHDVGDLYRYVHNSEATMIGTSTAVVAANGRAVEVRVPAGGVAILAPA